MQNKLIVLSSPSGGGKNTIADILMKKNKQIEETISCTTRKKRTGEKNNKHYYFISEENFKNKINRGEFIEWEKVHNLFFYGTLKSEISKIVAKKKTPLLVIDVEGGMNIKKIFPCALLIFIKQNSFKNLESRIKKRDKISEEKVKARIKTAPKELKASKRYDHIVSNPEGHPEKATDAILKILENYLT